MNKVLKYLAVLVILIFVFALPALAASSSFLAKAQAYYDSSCNKKTITNETSLECYVFDKVNELGLSISSISIRVTEIENKNLSQDQQIIDLQDKNVSQDAQISDLKNRVKSFEDNQPPAPSDFQFFNGPVSVSGSNSGIFDAKDYTKITLTYQAQTALYLNVSADQSSWVTQYEIGEGTAKAGGSITLNTAGRYYQVSSGSTTLPQAQVTAYVLGNFSN